MKSRILMALSGAVFFFVSSAALAVPVPTDTHGFLTYVANKLRNYSDADIAVAGGPPYLVTFTNRSTGNQRTFSLDSLHDYCVQQPSDCDDQTGKLIAGLSESDPEDVRPPVNVPHERAAFVAYLAAELAKLLPNVKVEADDPNLVVTRPRGHSIEMDQTHIFQMCADHDFQCPIDDYLRSVSGQFDDVDIAKTRSVLHIMARCTTIASVGTTMSCKIRPSPDESAAFFRRAFSNLEELCFKRTVSGRYTYMTNGDRHTQDLTMDEALDQCDASTKQALGPLDAKLKPGAADGIGEIEGQFASSFMLFPEEWASLAKQYNGLLLVSVPSVGHLLYMKGGTEKDVQTMLARTKEMLEESSDPVCPDIYRWTSSGWELATDGSVVNYGLPQVFDTNQRVLQIDGH